MSTLRTTWEEPFYPGGYAVRQCDSLLSGPPEAMNPSPQKIASAAIFACDNGDIGIGSNEMQKRDLFCCYPGFDFGAVLRRESSHFTLVSKAIVSGQDQSTAEKAQQLTGMNYLLTKNLEIGSNQTSEDQFHSINGERFHVMLDLTAY